MQGYRVGPGTYTAVLSVEGEESRQSFEVLVDPMLDLTPADYEEQQTYLAGLYAYTDEIHASVNQMNAVKEQVANFVGLAKDREEGAPIVSAGEALIEKIDTWKTYIIQEKQKTFQDVINFPNKLNAPVHLYDVFRRWGRALRSLKENGNATMISLQNGWRFKKRCRRFWMTMCPRLTRCINNRRCRR